MSPLYLSPWSFSNKSLFYGLFSNLVFLYSYVLISDVGIRPVSIPQPLLALPALGRALWEISQDFLRFDPGGHFVFNPI